MKKITVAVLLLVVARELFAQDCSTCRGSNNLSITTGLNTSGALMPMPTTATGGVVDPYWQLINVAPPSANGAGGISIPNAYTVQFGPSVGIPTWLNQPGADALSVIPNHQFSTNNSVASQPWRFLRKFNLCQNSSVRFVVAHMGDDLDTVKIFDSTGALLYTNTGVGWGTVHDFDKTLEMHAGCCYMTVELANTGAALMGFSVKADLSVTNGSLSNPNEVCCATSTVSGQKILDSNCNGKFDAGDLPGVGWTFNLLSGSSVVQTAITDANGEFTFYNVPKGTYTIQEVSQSGYTPGSPPSGQQTVVVGAVNSVQTFQFFNCKAPPISPTPSPTVTPTPTPVPGCADVSDKEIKCLPSGGYSYTFTVTNNSGKPMSQILLTPAQGGTFTLTPALTNLSSPLANGQSTTVTVNIGNAKPGDKVCFFTSLMADQTACCTVQVCPTLPNCNATTTSPTPSPTASASPSPTSRSPSTNRRP
jgi:hypothetical protein